MSVVLIIGPNEYRCSCGGKLDKADNARGRCPVCCEKLSGAVTEAEFLKSRSNVKKSVKRKKAVNENL